MSRSTLTLIAITAAGYFCAVMIHPWDASIAATIVISVALLLLEGR